MKWKKTSRKANKKKSNYSKIATNDKNKIKDSVKRKRKCKKKKEKKDIVISLAHFDDLCFPGVDWEMIIESVSIC